MARILSGTTLVFLEEGEGAGMRPADVDRRSMTSAAEGSPWCSKGWAMSQGEPRSYSDPSVQRGHNRPHFWKVCFP